jgi:hypothetical protein
MKKLFILLSASIALNCAAWQLQIPLGQSPSGDDSGKKVRNNQRVLTGMVTDKNDQPIPNAVVYLKNEKTLNVRSFFTQQDGTYRFPQLERNIDYLVYAELDGKRSDTKTVSQFDDRNTPRVNLKINLNK